MSPVLKLNPLQLLGHKRQRNPREHNLRLQPHTLSCSREEARVGQQGTHTAPGPQGLLSWHPAPVGTIAFFNETFVINKL